MPDWFELVKSRLGPLGIDPQREAEIVAELASHLEDLHEDYRWRGGTEEASLEQVMGSVSDWAEVRREISNSREGPMNQRSRTVWLPGLVMLTVCAGLLSLLIRSGVEPLTIFLAWHHPLQFYIPWLITLPFFGALGAYVVKCLGGARKARLLVGVFPSACMFGLLVFGLLADLIVDVGGGRHSVWHGLCGCGSFFLSFALVPGLALLLGVLPFLKNDSGRVADGSPRVANGTPNDDSHTSHLMLSEEKWSRTANA